MANATADAPVRANKAPPKAKAPPTRPTAHPVAPAPEILAVDATSLATAKAMQMVSVLMSGILDIDDFSSLDSYADQLRTLNSQVDRLAYGDADDQPVQITRREVAQLQMMFTSTIDAVEATVSSLPRGTVFLVVTLARQAEDLLGRIADAMEASAATLGPLNALGTYTGVRPRREPTQQPPRRVVDASEGAYNHAQLLTALSEIASRAQMVSEVLGIAQQTKDTFNKDALIASADAHVRHLGAMADVASGSNYHGDHDVWNYGPNFAHEGKTGAA